MPAAYPLLRPATKQADPGLPHTIPISDVDDLQDMQNNLMGNYYLTGNIDASITSTWNGGDGFNPVGYFLGNTFGGTLDGCGYHIYNLTVNRPTEIYNGLFGWARDTVKIANLTLDNVTINGDDYNGGLVGLIDSDSINDPLIQNCHVSGSITSRPGGYQSQKHGGLVGSANGSDSDSSKVLIYDSSAAVNIDCTLTESTCWRVGGFIGKIQRTIISNCHASGNIVAGDSDDKQCIGGFIGLLDEDTWISDCSASGNVSGYKRVGGFLGLAQNSTGTAHIKRSSATGNVSISAEAGATCVGGFSGDSRCDTEDCFSTGDVHMAGAVGLGGGFLGIVSVPGGPTVKQCYSYGKVTGGNVVGGFVAAHGSGVFTDDFWDTEASGIIVSDGGTGKKTKWFGKKNNYPVSWDFDNVWYMPSFGRQAVMGRPRGSYPVGCKHTALRNVYI